MGARDPLRGAPILARRSTRDPLDDTATSTYEDSALSVHYLIHRGFEAKTGDLLNPISRAEWEAAVRLTEGVRLRPPSNQAARSEAEVCVGRRRCWFTGLMWSDGMISIDMEVFMQGNGLSVPLKLARILDAHVYDTDDRIQRSSKALRLWLGGKLGRLIALMLTGASR